MFFIIWRRHPPHLDKEHILKKSRSTHFSFPSSHKPQMSFLGISSDEIRKKAVGHPPLTPAIS